MLRSADWKIERHDDHFGDSTKDVDWIRGAGGRNWVILTADERIRYKPAEKTALLDSGTHTFLLASQKNLTGREMGEVFLAAGSAIRRAIERFNPPAIFKVYSTGRLELWLGGKTRKRFRKRRK